MKLKDLLQGISVVEMAANPDMNIEVVSLDITFEDGPTREEEE